MWEYLIEEGYSGAEIIDLRDFNKWVAKHRGRAYDRRTIKAAAERLEEMGVLQKEKSFTTFVKKWVVKPLGALMKPILRQGKGKKGKRCNLRSTDATLEASKGSNGCQEIVTTTADLINQLPEEVVGKIEINLNLCEEVGIFYDPSDVPEILFEDPEDVRKAIGYYKEYSEKKPVKNPPGFLRKCLEFQWWKKKSVPNFSDTVIALAKYFGVEDRIGDERG
jgi:hypothetical protein